MGNTTSTLRRIIVAGCIGMVQLNVAEIKNREEYERILNLEAGVPHSEHGKFIWYDMLEKKFIEMDILGVLVVTEPWKQGVTKLLHVRTGANGIQKAVFWDETWDYGYGNPQKMKWIRVDVVDGDFILDWHDRALDHKAMTYVASGQPESQPKRPRIWRSLRSWRRKPKAPPLFD